MLNSDAEPYLRDILDVPLTDAHGREPPTSVLQRKRASVLKASAQNKKKSDLRAILRTIINIIITHVAQSCSAGRTHDDRGPA